MGAARLTSPCLSLNPGSLRVSVPGRGGNPVHRRGRAPSQVARDGAALEGARPAVWLPRFGHLRTLTLPSHLADLNAQLHDWRRTLAASSCSHRRPALIHLVRLLYGRRAAVDLIELVRFPPAPPQPRWVQRTHIDAILAQLTPGSKTQVRLELMHWTGMPPSQMGRLTLADFHLQEPIPYVSVPRGKRARLAAVPLVDEAVAATRAFIESEAFGTWSTPRANKAISHRGPEGATRTVHRVSASTTRLRGGFDTRGRPRGHPGLVLGTPPRRRPGSTQRRRSRNSGTRSGGCGSWPTTEDAGGSGITHHARNRLK